MRFIGRYPKLGLKPSGRKLRDQSLKHLLIKVERSARAQLLDKARFDLTQHWRLTKYLN
jgi:hypothetical protein